MRAAAGVAAAGVAAAGVAAGVIGGGGFRVVGAVLGPPTAQRSKYHPHDHTCYCPPPT